MMEATNMGKTKLKELQDIMDFPVISPTNVPDEKRLQVAREVNQQLYDGLLSVKGADYLREKGITPSEQWNSDNFWEKSGELRSCYQREYSLQQKAQFEKWRLWLEIGLVGLGAICFSVYIIGNDYLRQRKDARADYLYCQNLFQRAQNESLETQYFVRRNTTAPNSGRLCDLVLVEESKK